MLRVGFKRGLGSVAVAAVCALALASCGQGGDAPTTEETQQTPGADRNAELAAEQLAALGGAADAATTALYTGEFQASGTLGEGGSGEGAWEYILLEDYGQFTRPGLLPDAGFPEDRVIRSGGMQVTVGATTLTLRAEECPLPTGETLPYTALVLFEGVAYPGCARRGVDEGQRPTWASVLPDLLPAIDACLTRVSSRPARITTASLIDDGMVSVRIRESDGLRRECIAAADGSGVSAYEPVSDIDRRAGEGDPEFQRAGPEPAAANCRAIEPATDANGAALGWLIRRTC